MPNRVAVDILQCPLIHEHVIWGHSLALGFAGPITFLTFVVDLSWHQCAVRRMVHCLHSTRWILMSAAIYSYNTCREETPPPKLHADE